MRDFSFHCKPAKGEQIETCLTLASADSAAICGTVSDEEGSPVTGALALLFRDAALIAQAVTDAEGQFAFGALEGDILYRVKVFRQNTRIRELVIPPADGDS